MTTFKSLFPRNVRRSFLEVALCTVLAVCLLCPPWPSAAGPPLALTALSLLLCMRAGNQNSGRPGYDARLNSWVTGRCQCEFFTLLTPPAPANRRYWGVGHVEKTTSKSHDLLVHHHQVETTIEAQAGEPDNALVPKGWKVWRSKREHSVLHPQPSVVCSAPSAGCNGRPLARVWEMLMMDDDGWRGWG